jgi:quinolinate synthase
VGWALNGAANPLEPADAFNIPVPEGTEGGKNMSTAFVPAIERAPSCSLDNYLVLPDRSMDQRIAAAKRELSGRAVILGHHYQRDEVIRFADFRGDSYKLAQEAARTSAEYIVFCGVHFMAESADVLAQGGQQVILPDLNAGCSMADMAEIGQVESCWEQLVGLGLTDELGRGITPLTYMNSTAAIKAFVGERGGLVCTSSNAGPAFEWAFQRNGKILFLPDQHLGRNTAYTMGISLEQCVVWNPFMPLGGLTAEQLRQAKVILWKGHCSVHQRFLPEHVDNVRERYPGIKVIVHPECRLEVCQKADGIGSTEKLIKMIADAPAGTKFAVGTEIHLVNRMGKEFLKDNKLVITLDDSGCLCTTMFRISPQHLCWALENLMDGNVVNRIQVPAEVKHWSRVALDRMLEIS